MIRLKVKGITRKDWYRVEKSYTKLAKTTFEDIDYYISATYFQKIKERKEIQVHDDIVCILDDDYIWLHIIPIGKNYAITVNINREHEVVQWYFDVTYRNFLDSSGLPYYEDLYIDVVLDKSGEISFLDEDELEEAYEKKEITEAQYEFALKEANYLKYILPSNLEQLEKVSKRWLNILLPYFQKDLEKKESEIVDKRGNVIHKKSQFREMIKPGMRVKIVLKKDQPTGILTEGIVQKILTHSPIHHRGIKVMLEDGSVGRVQEIIE